MCTRTHKPTLHVEEGYRFCSNISLHYLTGVNNGVWEPLEGYNVLQKMDTGQKLVEWGGQPGKLADLSVFQLGQRVHSQVV